MALDESLGTKSTLTIRNIPLPLYRKLKKRAAEAGLSLPRFVLRELERFDAQIRFDAVVVRRPMSKKEFFKRLHAQTPVKLSISAAEIIREHRGPLP